MARTRSVDVFGFGFETGFETIGFEKFGATAKGRGIAT
jgi:hypothetical protein